MRAHDPSPRVPGSPAGPSPRDAERMPSFLRGVQPALVTPPSWPFWIFHCRSCEVTRGWGRVGLCACIEPGMTLAGMPGSPASWACGGRLPFGGSGSWIPGPAGPSDPGLRSGFSPPRWAVCVVSLRGSRPVLACGSSRLRLSNHGSPSHMLQAAVKWGSRREARDWTAACRSVSFGVAGHAYR